MHLYIHIPFCKQKCTYCNFHFSTLLKNKSAMVDSICDEIKMRKNEIQNPLKTIYFGGGTPSVLSKNELELIFSTIQEVWAIEPNAEITLEANPDDLTLEKLEILASFGINRLSIGVQSFFDEDLTYMNRAHNSKQAFACIQLAQRVGIENISIDLIYGSPTTSDEQWQQNLNYALQLDVPHVSAYALTVEPQTVLAHQIKKGIVANVEEEMQQRHFKMLVTSLQQNGFDAYEVSNFGKKGFYSQHNQAYWKGVPYLGIGPSAHSFDGNLRSWNVANNSIYQLAIAKGEIPLEVESLSDKDRLNELTMIGLRTQYGINLLEIEKLFSPDLVKEWRKEVDEKLKIGQLIEVDNNIRLDAKFRFFADGIASDLFIL